MKLLFCEQRYQAYHGLEGKARSNSNSELTTDLQIYIDCGYIDIKTQHIFSVNYRSHKSQSLNLNGGCHFPKTMGNHMGYSLYLSYFPKEYKTFYKLTHLNIIFKLAPSISRSI